MTEVERLRQQWDDALAKHRQVDTDKTNAAEQVAYDALVDYVEANDLNYSHYDPRPSK